MKSSHFVLILAIGGLGTFTGCTSVKSTYFYRNDDDTHWKKKRTKGIPITLEVPTHVRFNVIQRYLLANGQPLKVPDPTKDDPARMSVYVARDVRYDLITEKKIFTVDMKRPAAGPYQNVTTLDNQYFKQIDHRLEDKTIETVGKQVNDLVSKFLPIGSAGAGKSQSGADAGNTGLVPLESVVCSQVFKLDAPDFESQVAAFLQDNCGPMAAIPVDKKVQNVAIITDLSGGGGGAFTPGGQNVGNSGADGKSGTAGPPPTAPDGGNPPDVGPSGAKPPAAAKPAAAKPAAAPSAATGMSSTTQKPVARSASPGSRTSPTSTSVASAATSRTVTRGLDSRELSPQALTSVTILTAKDGTLVPAPALEARSSNALR